MSQFFQIHAINPQKRLIGKAGDILKKGGVIAYPTDSAYALGCIMGDKIAMDRIRDIRRLDSSHNFTLVCRDLSEISTYTQLNNSQYRMLRSTTPGAYTFIMKGSKEVPRRLMHPKRRTIGLRVPDCPIVQALIEEVGAPIMSSTLQLPDEDLPLTDALVIRIKLEHKLDLIIDGGNRGFEVTTVVSLLNEFPEIMRAGKGDISLFDI